MGTYQLDFGATAPNYPSREFVPELLVPAGPGAEWLGRWSGRGEYRRKPNSHQGNMVTSGRFSKTTRYTALLGEDGAEIPQTV